MVMVIILHDPFTVSRYDRYGNGNRHFCGKHRCPFHRIERVPQEHPHRRKRFHATHSPHTVVPRGCPLEFSCSLMCSRAGKIIDQDPAQEAFRPRSSHNLRPSALTTASLGHGSGMYMCCTSRTDPKPVYPRKDNTPGNFCGLCGSNIKKQRFYYHR